MRGNPDFRKGKMTIDGILTASEWDESGNATDIKLLTFDDDEYRIENGKPFLNMIKQPVRVAGIVRINVTGLKTIKITTCSIRESL